MLKSYLNIQAKFAGLFLWFTLSEFVVMIKKKNSRRPPEPTIQMDLLTTFKALLFKKFSSGLKCNLIGNIWGGGMIWGSTLQS